MADYNLQYQDTYIDALLATANELKTAGYIYKGVATPSTNPGTPTERVAYLASEPGTYTNFGGIVIASGLYSLTYASGTWTGTQMSAGSDIEVVQTAGQSTSDVMSQKAVTDMLFDKDIINVSVPTVSTSSAGTNANGAWGNVLNNADAFDLSSIRLYCKTARTSFVLAVGQANTTAKTYSISHSYTINKPLSVGENVVDVSEYNIVIPANALVVCTGATSYRPNVTGITMVGTISTTEGASGSYGSNFVNNGMQFVLIGTHTDYIPKIDVFESGEKVSEVSIINNLNDGGESDVLSAEQGKNLDSQFIDLVSSSFNTETANVETPQVSTGTAGTGLSGNYFGTILTNKTKITLQQVKFYSNAAKTSFKIAVGTADINNKTYHIDNNYTITASVSAGENTIDVSNYHIEIPPKSLVACDGATHYKRTQTGESLVGTMRSINAGASGSFSVVYPATLQCVFIGTAKEYTIIIPDDVIEAFGQSNVLFRKKYVAIGDSFTYKSTAYPHIIGNRNNMTVINQGASGSALNGYIVQGKYNQIPQDVDYVTIWYGINDANHGISVGTINDEPTTITSETSTTTCGGFNWFFKWLLTNRPLAHIGVIVTDFCEQARREAIIACCQKWGIAYLDLYDPTIPMIRTRGNTHYSHDTSIAPLGYVEVCSDAKALRTAVFSTDPATSNMHPNDDCHKWQSNLIENFMRGL